MNVKQFNINPKSISMNELYGYVNPANQEWQDGLGSMIIREVVSEYEEAQNSNKTDPSEDSTMTRQNWILFDGPIDPKWIENLNTVLDDS